MCGSVDQSPGVIWIVVSMGSAARPLVGFVSVSQLALFIWFAEWSF
jgi:hypothetical protein